MMPPVARCLLLYNVCGLSIPPDVATHPAHNVMASGSSEQPIAVYGAMAANFAIAITKFVAASLTGSAAMFSEGIHSLVDTGNQALLLLGIRLGRRSPDETHPFGYGKELYFWTLIVAIVLFAGGGGISLYEGVSHLLHPVPLENPVWNYVVLGLAALFEGIAWTIAFRELLRAKGESSVWQAVRRSKDPAVFVVLFEDTAAMLGLLVAALGLFLGYQFNNPYLDGVASIIIGGILAVIAILLVYESRALLIGETADLQTVASIRALAQADPAVEQVERPLTMHLGPNDVLLNLNIQFRRDLSTTELAVAVDRLEKAIRDKHPDIKRIFIETEILTTAAGVARSDGSVKRHGP